MLQKLLLRLAELSVVLLLIAAILLAWRQERADRTQLQSQFSASNQALAAATASQQSRDAQLATTLAAIAAQKKASATLTPDQLLAAIATQAHLPSPITLLPRPSATSPSDDASATQASPTPPTNSATSPASNPAGNQPARTLAANSEQAATPANPPPVRGSRPPANSSASNSSGQAAPQPANSSSGLPDSPTAQIPTGDLGPLYNYLLDCQACQSKLAAAQSDLADEKTKTAALTQSRDAALKAAKGGTIFQRAARALKWFAIGAAAGAIAAKTVR